MLASPFLTAALVVLALVSAAVIDIVILGSNHLIASLYGVPILLAAPRWGPRAVVALAALVVTLHAIASAVQQENLELWLLYALSLVTIAALGILLSVQRQQTDRRAREAEVARQQLQTFMSMVAHELATPVTGVLGRAQLALRTARQSRERRALVAIEAEARGLTRLVRDLRDAGSAGAGRFEIDPEATDLADLVTRVVERQRGAATDREIVLDLRAEPLVECDRGRIMQVVDNLISNAIKYSPAGEPVVVQVGHAGEDALISVTDRGPGIGAASRARLFQPFMRLEATLSTPGTGLGLFISQAIVQAHGGVIDLISTVGAGSTFTVRLPGAADPEPNETVADAQTA